MADLFRKTALDTVATPEQLDKQVKIVRPATWVICLIFVIGMITFMLWSVTYHITDGVNMQGVVFTNNNIIQTKASRECMVTDVLVNAGEYVEAGDIIAVLSYDEMLAQIAGKREELANQQEGSQDYERIETQIQKLTEEYTARTIIKSTHSGYVRDVVNNGCALAEGEEIMSLMPDNGYNEVVAYVSKQTAQQLELGMTAQISPVYAPREEYGYMTGAITSIGEIPVTEDNIISKMGSLSYVENILLDSASFVEVRMKLEIDGDSDNHYHWSNKKGEAVSVEMGTQCSIIVVTKEYLPIELLLQ